MEEVENDDSSENRRVDLNGPGQDYYERVRDIHQHFHSSQDASEPSDEQQGEQDSLPISLEQRTPPTYRTAWWTKLKNATQPRTFKPFVVFQSGDEELLGDAVEAYLQPNETALEVRQTRDESCSISIENFIDLCVDGKDRVVVLQVSKPFFLNLARELLSEGITSRRDKLAARKVTIIVSVYPSYYGELTGEPLTGSSCIEWRSTDAVACWIGGTDKGNALLDQLGQQRSLGLWEKREAEFTAEIKVFLGNDVPTDLSALEREMDRREDDKSKILKNAQQSIAKLTSSAELVCVWIPAVFPRIPGLWFDSISKLLLRNEKEVGSRDSSDEHRGNDSIEHLGTHRRKWFSEHGIGTVRTDDGPGIAYMDSLKGIQLREIFELDDDSRRFFQKVVENGLLFEKRMPPSMVRRITAFLARGVCEYRNQLRHGWLMEMLKASTLSLEEEIGVLEIDDRQKLGEFIKELMKSHLRSFYFERIGNLCRDVLKHSEAINRPEVGIDSIRIFLRINLETGQSGAVLALSNALKEAPGFEFATWMRQILHQSSDALMRVQTGKSIVAYSLRSISAVQSYLKESCTLLRQSENGSLSIGQAYNTGLPAIVIQTIVQLGDDLSWKNEEQLALASVLTDSTDTLSCAVELLSHSDVGAGLSLLLTEAGEATDSITAHAECLRIVWQGTEDGSLLSSIGKRLLPALRNNFRTYWKDQRTAAEQLVDSLQSQGKPERSIRPFRKLMSTYRGLLSIV